MATRAHSNHEPKHTREQLWSPEWLQKSSINVENSCNFFLGRPRKIIFMKNFDEGGGRRKGGGAPKFFLSWLTFALYPYDADRF